MAFGEGIRAGMTTRARLTARPESITWLAVGAALLFGAIVRILPAWSSDFPLNDGGMFYLMAAELRQHHYLLPATTAYNGANIPYAYPPLGFYLAALLSDLAHIPLIDVVRVLPSCLALLTIPAYAALARALCRSQSQVIIAVFAFTLLPRAFTWLIMGGGLTRAPGALFSILTLWQVHRLYTRGDRRSLLPSIACGGLTVLSHAEWAWFTAYSAAIFFLFLGRNRRGVVNSLLVAAGVAAVSAPWWGTVIAHHGVAPLLAAMQAGGNSIFSIAYPLTFKFSAEPFLPILAVLGLIGVFACLAERALLIPSWLLTILIIQPRSAPTLATIPLALLVAIALDRIVVPGLHEIAAQRDQRRSNGQARATRPGRLGHGPSPLVLLYVLLYSLINAISVPYMTTALHVLPQADREAMAWVTANTASSDTFLVLDSDGLEQGWEQDRPGEWFPALTGRKSLNTVQGTEWLPEKHFAAQQSRYIALYVCADEGIACLDAWARENNKAFTYIFIAKENRTRARVETGCCDPLLGAVRVSGEFTIAYDGPGATIFVRSASR